MMADSSSSSSPSNPLHDAPQHVLTEIPFHEMVVTPSSSSLTTSTQSTYSSSSSSSLDTLVDRFIIHVDSNNNSSSSNNNNKSNSLSFTKVSPESENDRENDNDKDKSEGGQWYSRMKGFSSFASTEDAPELKHQHQPRHCFLQTSANVDNYNILCCASTLSTNTNTSSKTSSKTSADSGMKKMKKQIEIDFSNLYSSASTKINPIIITSSFFVGKNQLQQRPVWKIVCVDSNANVIVVQLDYSNLHPIYMEYLSSPNSTMSLSSTSITTDKLSPSQITFLSHNQILYVNPKGIITNFNLQTKSYTVWKSLNCCLDYKKKSLGYFTCAKGLLIGKSPMDIVGSMLVDDNDDDNGTIPYTIAICSLCDLETMDQDYDKYNDGDYDDEEDENISKVKAICSLHIDGSIRIWTLLPSSITTTDATTVSKMKMYPLNMKILTFQDQVGGRHWSSSMEQIWGHIQQEQQSDSVQSDDSRCGSDDIESFISLKGTFFRESAFPSTSAGGKLVYDDDDEGDKKNGLVGVYIHIKNRDANKSQDGHNNYQYLTLYSFEVTSSSSTIRANMDDLVIPSNVTSMIDMGFSHTELDASTFTQGCKLNVLYNCATCLNTKAVEVIGLANVPHHSSTLSHCIQLALYKPNIANPLLINGNEEGVGTIDSMGLKVREEVILQMNILSSDIYAGPDLGVDSGHDQDEDDDNGSILESKMNSVDEWYMKRLFRPAYGRYIGCNSSIERAMNAVIPFSCLDELKNHDFGRVEVKVITAMKRWAELSFEDEEKNNESLFVDVEMSPPSMIGEVVDSAMSGDDTFMNDINACNESRSNGKRQLLSHHNRWCSLLLATWNEEAKLQTPMSLIIPPKMREAGIVLRVGSASTIAISNKFDSKSCANAVDKLDYLSKLLLEALQRGDSNKLLITDFEMKIWDVASKAKLVFEDEAEALDLFFHKISQGVDGEMMRPLFSEVAHLIEAMTSADVMTWLSSPFSSSCSSESMYPSPRKGRKSENDSQDQEASLIVPFSASIARRYVETICRSMLARCLLVVSTNKTNEIGNIFGMNERNCAFRTFLHSISMFWLHMQLASTAKGGNREGSKVPPPLLAFSPAKKSRIEITPAREIHTPPTILEYHIKDLFATSGKDVAIHTYDVGNIIAMAKACVRSAYNDNTTLPTFISNLTNKSRLALRLLAPSISFPPPSHQKIDSSIRNAMVADFLLTEVDSLSLTHQYNEELSKKILKRASILLLENTNLLPLSSYKNDTDIFFSTMRSLPNDWISSRSVTSDQYHDKRLLELLHCILEPHSSSIHEDEIKRLAKMDTLRKLLLPWVIVSQRERVEPFDIMLKSLSKVTSDPKGVVSKSILSLLHISNLMNRATVIEKHSTSVTNTLLKASYAEILFSAIDDIIKEIKTYYTPSVYEHMGECAALWSSAFRHALIGYRWDDAFRACLSNPLDDRRVKNFKRLVLAMVEAGALDKLINNILFTVVDWHSPRSEMEVDGESDNVIDFYELAAETLSQAASERTSSVVGQFETSSSKSSVNYAGCLYTLHAAHNEWRRCCQAMDLYEIMSQGNLLAAENLTLSREQQNELHRNTIDEIVLSSVASSQLIHLIPQKGHRYIVRGELNPYPVPPALKEPREKEVDGELLSKRVREGDHLSPPNTSHGNEFQSSGNRLSRLLTEQQISLRATRSMAFRTLYFDSLSPESLIDILETSDRQLIEALSRLGYFSHVIAIANCKRDEKQRARPGGRDVLVDAIGHMICQYLLPNTTKLLRSMPGEEWVDEDEEDDGIQHRPTLNQLRLSYGNGSLIKGCETWRSDTRNNEVERGFFAMSLVQNYTTKYSDSGNSLSKEVAQTLLDLGFGRSELPLWLHTLLLGEPNGNIDGLFAKRNGNPAELLRLYMRKGLLSLACKVVCEVLTCRGREEHATYRLPEKGSIDYVPYGIIDELWNLIEANLQSTNCSRDLKDDLLQSREKMEKAIIKHFELMKISDIGMLSARALNPY